MGAEGFGGAAGRAPLGLASAACAGCGTAAGAGTPTPAVVVDPAGASTFADTAPASSQLVVALGASPVRTLLSVARLRAATLTARLSSSGFSPVRVLGLNGSR